ncbi:hypothetical protein SXCC_03243 [Gluconacetobacter sp. SXCC-1]|nr:hypothetical protein SXCC_03243 [Gluconacetobacter sp. SXCC-1]
MPAVQKILYKVTTFRSTFQSFLKDMCFFCHTRSACAILPILKPAQTR